MQQRTYDRIKDTPDSRDHLAMRAAFTLPPLEDLTPWLGPVKDQGALGSCTAHAGTGIREFLYRKLNQWEHEKDVQPHDFRLSPLFLYAMEREIEGDLGSDAGAQSRSIFKALATYGCALEAEYPYVEANFKNDPTKDGELMKLAESYKAISYHRVPDIMTLKSVLASGYAATVGTPLFSSFESDRTADDGLVFSPLAGESCIGGHEMLVFGYDDARAAFHVRNSWGADWGDRGNCWIPYGYFNHPAVLAEGGADFWTAHLGKPW